MAPTLTERVRSELQRLHRGRRFRQTRVAERLGIVPSAVSRVISQDDRPITLAFLETVAEEAQVPVAELVAPPGALVKQLDVDEAAVLRFIRSWPKSVVHALLTFLQYWADEPPTETQTRRLHEYWRGMGAKDREWFFTGSPCFCLKACCPQTYEKD